MKTRTKTKRQPLYRRKSVIIPFLTAIVLIAGGAWFLTHRASPPPPPLPLTAPLTIIRTNQFGRGANVRVTSDQATADKLRAELDAMPTDEGTYNCPADDGTQVTLEFLHPRLTVEVGGAGCSFLVGYGNKTVKMTDGTFWNDLNDAAGKTLGNY